MRKRTLIAVFVAAVCLLLNSCFKDEAPNTECDILEASLHVDRPETMFYHASDSVVRVISSDQSVSFVVRHTADLTALAPTFRITEGATIEPASGSVHDFSKGGVAYTVTSEDGQWQRRYVVTFRPPGDDVPGTVCYDFEHYMLEPTGQKFYLWLESNSAGQLSPDWATGNAGYSYSKSTAQPEEFPTIPVADGYEGAGVKLTTMDTGAFGRMANMRLAAGNLFLGVFNADVALRNAMLATEMGLPFTQEPLRLSGYYRYQPGPQFQDRQGNPVDRTDQADVYSVLYRNHDSEGNPVVLYGDSVLTSPQIVRLARVASLPPTDEWKPFEVDYQSLGDIDATLLANRGYSLALVFTSSIEGASFMGAVGSTLYIDKVRIACKTEE